MLELVGLPKDSKALPPSATEAEMEMWDPEQGYCCMLANFCIDLSGNARSAWNKSAAKVFATGYLKKHKNCEHSREIIEKGWLRYMTGLKTKSRLQKKDTAGVREHKAMHQQKQRKMEVCLCCWSAIPLTVAISSILSSLNVPCSIKASEAKLLTLYNSLVSMV